MKTDPPTTPTPDSPSTPKFAKPRGRVFDVMAPGKAPASPTSRPVVIGHKAGAQAAQVRVSGIGAGDGDLLSEDKRHSVQPVGDGNVAVTVAVDADAPKLPKSEPAEATASEPVRPVEVVEKLPEPKKPMESPEAETPAAPDKLAEAALEPEPPAPAPAADHAVVPQSNMHESEHGDQLLHEMSPPSLDGQVVVSHHTTEPRGTGKLIGLIALMLLFALIVLDILLDVGIINSSAIPHTSFF